MNPSGIFPFEQIVIHSLQCTHYVILWNLAKSSEGSSRKVRSPKANCTVLNWIGVSVTVILRMFVCAPPPL